MNEILANVFIALLGIVGTFLGARYGGKKTIDAVKIGIQNEENIKSREEQKRIDTIKRIIAMFLKNELEHNNLILKEKKIFEGLAKETIDYGTCNIKDQFGLKTERYDEVKSELIKYIEVPIIEKIVRVYYYLDSICLHENLNLISKNDLAKMIKYEDEYRALLDEIDNIRI
ncbi:hypothetical protein FDB15_09780 [Clostridium botulinum]|nr:hypothetical protein [Clostridium botulinum]NFI02591.1 hypothetical protein [Clostridium botulinum]NFI58225.1 hypothetical protein [Clostridium botulinum]NFI65012.1 hypothetical protein [Clostridium botulinum]NFJ45504.1 hypothetical protein [Clostridium botulinum]